MNLNPTVRCYPQPGLGSQPISFYSYPVERPHSINITLASTNLNTNYIVQDSNETNNPHFYPETSSISNNKEKKPRKKSKEYSNLNDELKKEKQKNQILVLKVIELEKLLKQMYCQFKNNEKKPLEFTNFAKGPSFPMEKDREVVDLEAHETKKNMETEKKEVVDKNNNNNNNKETHNNDLIYVKSIEKKMEGLLRENERLSKIFHEQSEELEKHFVTLEEKYNEKNKNMEILLLENGKLRNLIQEIKEKDAKQINILEEELKDKEENNARLQKENNVIVHSIAITNERQHIEKSKLACLSEQNSYLESKNKILQEEIHKLKGKT